VTRALSLLGGSLPEPLWRPDQANPTGYWEPVEAVELNNEILAGVGSAWNDPAPLPPHWGALPAAVTGVTSVTELARRWMALPPPTIVKDPRLCRLLPLWRIGLAAANAHVAVALVLRHPAAVVASLTARDGCTPDLAVWLWLEDVIAAETTTRDLQRTVVDYDALIAHPDRVGSIARELGLPAADAVSQSAIREFLRAGLRHHDGTVPIDATPMLVEIAVELHATLIRHSGDAAIDPVVTETVAAIAMRMAELERVVPDVLRRARDHTRAQLDVRDDWLHDEVAASALAHAAYGARLTDAAGETAHLKTTLESVRQELARTSDLLARTQQSRVLRYARTARRLLGRGHAEMWPPAPTQPAERAASASTLSRHDRSSSDVAFVLVVERGSLEWQSVMFVDSLRRWGGQLGTAPVYALSPRHDQRPRGDVVAELERLGAGYVDSVRNPDTSGYGTVNRIVAAAHIERTTGHDVVVVVDSDTLVLGPLDALALAPDVDMAARPVDVVGLSATGPDDAAAPYWEGLCRLAGTELSMLPRTNTTVDDTSILANYNGGLVAVRRSVGILESTEKLYFDAVTAGIKPQSGRRGLRAGAGPVPDGVAEIFGSAQAVLSVAAWTLTHRIDELPANYNVPLHFVDELSPTAREHAFPGAVHVHYHWLLDPDQPTDPLRTRSDSPLTADQRAWLDERLRWRGRLGP
jgi:hypothetical protein